MPPTAGRARAELRRRLEERRPEIEEAALTRVRAISDPAEVADPAYVEGLRAAVTAAIAYGIQTTGHEGAEPPVPVELLGQARMAARAGIPLDTVLRRYFAGYSLLGYFVLEEAGRVGIADGDELKRLLGAHAGLFDRLIAAVGEEYGREAEALAVPARRNQAERIERLLAGELVPTAEIAYDFDGWHLGLLAHGIGVEQSIRGLAADLDCRPLVLLRDERLAWAWLGSHRRPDPAELMRALAARREVGASTQHVFAVGEPGEGLSGWRITHQQAAVSLQVAQRSGGFAVRYADVALLASVLRDDLLSDSLRQLYLARLENDRDNGRTAKRTLRAYFAANRNVSSTAAALGVRRHTVSNRLCEIERRIDRPLGGCAAEVEVALMLDEIGAPNMDGAAGVD